MSKPSLLSRIYETIRGNVLLRNLITAISLLIIILFLVNILLGLYTRHGEKYTVPNFIGSTFDQAKINATDGEMRLEIIDSLYMPKQPPGAVLDQSPKPGMGVKSGRRIFLTINAFRPRMDVIPYVTGFSLRQAKNVLESKGFEIERLVYRNDMATNNVLEQTYKGRAITQGSNVEAELGSAITLVVGVNTESRLPQVPKVIGLSLREAKSRLWEMGFNVGRVRNDSDVTADNLEDARIYRQDPGMLSRYEYGGGISLWLTADQQKVSTSSRNADAESRKLPPDTEDDLAADEALADPEQNEATE